MHNFVVHRRSRLPYFIIKKIKIVLEGLIVIMMRLFLTFFGLVNSYNVLGDAMTIYLDLVFFVNFGFDFLLLLVVSVILKRNTKLRRILLGAVFGSLSIIFLFMDLNSISLFLLKLLVSVGMILLSFGYKDFKYTINNLTYLYIVSILLGGFLYYLNNEFALRNEGLVFVYEGLSINYILLIIMSPVILFLYVRKSLRLKNNYSSYYECRISFDRNTSVDVVAFLDTGNKLKDPYSNKGIILLNKKLLPKRVRSPILIPYHSLNSHGLLKCIKGFEIEIDNRKCNNFLIGISEEEFFMDGIDCIISNRIMEGLK